MWNHPFQQMGRMIFVIHFDKDTRVITVTPEGEIDHCLAESMRNAVDAAILTSTARLLVFDLTDVPFMDSSGIGMLIGRYKLMKKRGGNVRVRGMREQVSRVFRMSGLGHIIANEERTEQS